MMGSIWIHRYGARRKTIEVDAVNRIQLRKIETWWKLINENPIILATTVSEAYSPGRSGLHMGASLQFWHAQLKTCKVIHELHLLKLWFLHQHPHLESKSTPPCLDRKKVKREQRLKDVESKNKWLRRLQASRHQQRLITRSVALHDS